MEQQEKDSPSLKDDLLSSLRNPKSRTARILLVDDEQDITRIMARSLQINGFEVKAFNNPTEALSHFEPESCDLAILDIWMPGMNGFELYRELTKKGNVKVGSNEFI